MTRLLTALLVLLCVGGAVAYFVPIFGPSSPPTSAEKELAKVYAYYLTLFREMERCGIPHAALESSMDRAFARAALSKAEKIRAIDMGVAAAKHMILMDEGNDPATCAEIARRHEIAQSMIKSLP